ncbi:GAF domain-containing protein [Methylobacterium sp. E-065]|uniref:GAF domain-containing protein n=1 Tax=Methylobacterium sp. E-065 TaxID=2836583 RepID=UPI001FBB1E0B|nr:GAF domain-containing protein [Methylobacterium sp. E-065]MCJ2019495.1 GAF domain-containing protein [Methylobacterium sp. E-065]
MTPQATDPARLAVLEAYGILDTVPEQGFDDIVQLAASVCATPVALVSLVAADRQWFKARVGFPARETDLNSSVCAYALTAPDLLIIPDLTADPRTRTNPLVTGDPCIRFYAGVPLRSPEGHALGSLCVIDTTPRPGGLTSEQADNLRRLARHVMALLNERRQLVRLRISEDRLSNAFARQVALTEIGDHLRDLSTIPQMSAAASEIVGRTLEASRAGYGELDTTGAVIEILADWSPPGARTLLGRHRFADYGSLGPVVARGETLVIGDVTDDPLTADDARTFRRFNIQALLNVPIQEHGRTVAMLYVHDIKPRDWSPEEVVFVRNVADRVLAGVARLRAEEQQSTLNSELSHRMKNTLAMVQAIATQTMRNAVDLDAAQNTLSARLIALGRAHDMLLDQTGASADLAEVLREALAIHDDAQVGRLQLEGPAVKVGSKAALSLALVIHELATNAVKYGALSTADGYVQVRWSIEPTDMRATLHLRWSEHGGPPVTPPQRRGFGSRLIERGLAGSIGGEVALSYPPEGVVCEVSAKLAEIEADA